MTPINTQLNAFLQLGSAAQVQVRPRKLGSSRVRILPGKMLVKSTREFRAEVYKLGHSVTQRTLSECRLWGPYLSPKFLIQ